MNIEELNWLLVAVIVILLYYVIKGITDGFVRTIYEMFSVVIVAAAAAFCAPYISEILHIEVTQASFLTGYIILWLALKLLCNALDIISKLPILNALNKAAGVLVGLFRGILMVWLLFILITVFEETTWGSAAMEMLKQSRILQRLYDANLILRLLKIFIPK